MHEFVFAPMYEQIQNSLLTDSSTIAYNVVTTRNRSSRRHLQHLKSTCLLLYTEAVFLPQT